MKSNVLSTTTRRAIKSTTTTAMAGLLAASSVVGCGKSGSGGSYSKLAVASGFQQSAVTLNNKIDILWVVDNSGSMDPLQKELTDNFSSFITNFQTKGFDFKMGVTTTDAYLAETNQRNNQSFAQFKDGTSTQTGIRVITNTTPNLMQTFVTNATTGSVGSGDERAFSSLEDALNSPMNAGFHRAGAFLAVVILSDEDDFSNATRLEGDGSDHDYSQAGLYTINSVISALDTFTGGSASNRKFNVSAITVLDSACQQSHAQAASSTIIGQRYIQLANATSGILGSVCDSSFANSLNFIQQRITELVTSFQLNDEPNVSTIDVTVNGTEVAQDSTNGWTYSSANNSISFHGTSVPPASADVEVSFEPANFK